MNWYKYAAMMVALSVFVAIISAIEAPRKPKKEGETIYVLPLVEEMPSNPNPLSF
jgi:hypothetical protein